MDITVFGATGSVGGRVVAEAPARDHRVTAVVRTPARLPELPAAALGRTGDVRSAERVAELSAGQDVVVGATRPAPGSEGELATTRTLLAGAAAAGARLLVVGGAGSLTVPGAGGRTVLDDPRYLRPDWRAIAEAGAGQLAACRADASGADWTYLSPPARLEPGERTGRCRLGTDELLTDADGVSRITVADLAVALLDEAENPRHRRARFTVAY
ncbi:NAD(P)H-binding protein [Streptomyces sp. TRM 70361]|uniref:NAD(P)-dependent oxidoreductase n=1 Tax=Streptomyces sp. TRM 70361 TaxID=3116553 RepID=UPI002E7B69BF|nr:NAD(P)H-binding protein [Streptomyces sp. TRM 70361]MEE1941802.1 NAD(P)H-binding protein [Streptomyces sp. TRM 70361]